MASIFDGLEENQSKKSIFEGLEFDITQPSKSIETEPLEAEPVKTEKKESFLDRMSSINDFFQRLQKGETGNKLLDIGGTILNAPQRLQVEAGKQALSAAQTGQSALMNLSKNIIDVSKGKGLSYMPDMSYRQYAQGVAPESGLTKAIKSGTLGGNILGTGLEILSDPLTFVGGGVFDDLARAGRFGKAAQLGTVENIEVVASTGRKAAKGLKGGQEATETIADAILKKKPVEEMAVPKQFEGTGAKSGIVAEGFQPKAKSKKAFKFEEPKIEKTYQESKGIKQPTFFEKVTSGIEDTLNMFRRPIKSLPVTKENAEIYKELTRLPKIKSITGDDTIRVIDDITKELDKETFDLFSRKVLLEDLAEEASKGNALPNGFTKEIVEKELGRINKQMPDTVKAALKKRKEYWNTIKDDYIKAMEDVGVNVKDRFTKENYFRHQVLDYMEAKGVYGTGQRLKTPANRGFSMKRTGEYTGNINTDYLQAEYEVMAQMKHDTEISKTIKNIQGDYDISKSVKRIAKKEGLKNWKEAIPEGYTTWQPREGNVFYFADTIPENIANDLTEGILKEANINVEDLRQALAVGGKRKEFVVKKEIAETLNNLFKTRPSNVISKASKKVLNTWKRWVLTGNPRTVLKYNIRNFSGDLDPIIAANPSTLTKVKKSSKDLYNAFKNGNFSPELKSWYDRGGFQELLYAQEIGDINKLKPFERFKDKSLVKKGVDVTIGKYGEFTRNITNYREAVLRYSSYLDYMDQIKSGKLKNYGASKPEIIKGLKTAEDKAYKLANDLLGAYDEVSEAGQMIRNHLIPFYSWMEVNFKRYGQMIKNAATTGDVSSKVGLNYIKAATKQLSPKMASSVGKFAIKAFALTGVMALWNMLKYPELEDTLPDDVKARPHLILGQDKDGNTLYFSRLGALNDYLEWFGLDTAIQDIQELKEGRKTTKEQLTDMVKSPVNKLMNGITPFIKTPVEQLSGQKFYPDVFDSRPMREKDKDLAYSLGVGKEYDAIAGKPSKPYVKSLSQAILYKAEPKVSAYYKILNLKNKFKKKQGDTGEGFFQSPRSNALYNYKLALRYDDKEAQKKYFEKYKKLGGTASGMKRSLNSMDPLYGLSGSKKAQFLKSLTKREEEMLDLAIEYYRELR